MRLAALKALKCLFTLVCHFIIKRLTNEQIANCSNRNWKLIKFINKFRALRKISIVCYNGDNVFKNEAHFWVRGKAMKKIICNCFAPVGWVDWEFHQDDATCHTARETMDILKDKFGEVEMPLCDNRQGCAV